MGWTGSPCEVPAGVQPCLPAINAALTVGYAAGSTMAGDGCRRAPPMTQFAEHVYTAQHDIARIESWAAQLEDEARVEILLADGARVEGFVERKSVVMGKTVACLGELGWRRKIK